MNHIVGISQFIEEFRSFHAQFADCFSREEPRENFFQYMAGQMSQLERKFIEPIATYASRHGHCFLENRLFVPEKWFGEEYAKRKEKCKLSKEIPFRTKPQLGEDSNSNSAS